MTSITLKNFHPWAYMYSDIILEQRQGVTMLLNGGIKAKLKLNFDSKQNSSSFWEGYTVNQIQLSLKSSSYYVTSINYI